MSIVGPKIYKQIDLQVQEEYALGASSGLCTNPNTEWSHAIWYSAYTPYTSYTECPEHKPIQQRPVISLPSCWENGPWESDYYATKYTPRDCDYRLSTFDCESDEELDAIYYGLGEC
jgi:hypothetical protein